MKFNINNLICYTGSGQLVAEETGTPGKFVLVDATKRLLPTGVAYLEASTETKKGVTRTLIKATVPYTDAAGVEQRETYYTVRVGSAIGLIGAPCANDGTDVTIANNCAGALFAASMIIGGVTFGNAEDNIPHIVGSWPWDETPGAPSKEPTGLFSQSADARMNNPFVRAAMGLAPLEEGRNYNGTYSATGFDRPVVHVQA